MNYPESEKRDWIDWAFIIAIIAAFLGIAAVYFKEFIKPFLSE